MSAVQNRVMCWRYFLLPPFHALVVYEDMHTFSTCFVPPSMLSPPLYPTAVPCTPQHSAPGPVPVPALFFLQLTRQKMKLILPSFYQGKSQRSATGAATHADLLCELAALRKLDEHQQTYVMMLHDECMSYIRCTCRCKSWT